MTPMPRKRPVRWCRPTRATPRQVGASIPGMVSKLHVQPGDTVEENQVLMTIEAMKMETAVTARTAGKVREIRVKEGQAVKAKELLMLLD